MAGDSGEPIGMTELWILVLVVAVALVFDFTNGFHDTANSIAAAVGTRAMSPKAAVTMAAVLNFVGAMLSVEVALTVGKGVIDPSMSTQEIVLGGVVGAIAWNFITWYYGLPSSSSHALIGGLVGSGVAASGPSIVNVAGVVQKIAIPAVLAPTLGFLGALLFLGLLMRLSRPAEPRSAHKLYRRAQWFSSAWLSLTHGMNDAQKTMGIMFLAVLTFQGVNPSGEVDIPYWIRISAATAMAAGTFAGGWRIIKTLGSKVVKMQPVQGFTASTASAGVLFVASHLGLPVSTTHTVTGGVLGAGAGRRLSSVRWGVAGDIATAWVLTLPAAGAVGALTYYLVLIHPLLVVAAIAAGFWLLHSKSHGKRPDRSVAHGLAPRTSHSSPAAGLLPDDAPAMPRPMPKPRRPERADDTHRGDDPPSPPGGGGGPDAYRFEAAPPHRPAPKHLHSAPGRRAPQLSLPRLTPATRLRPRQPATGISAPPES